MMQINFHRARLGAGTAERTRVGKMFPILQAAQMRRDDRADGAAVGCAVSVAADVAENRTDVQARAASNAMERVALFGVGEQFRAMIVEQDDVEFLRAITFTGLARAAKQCIVTRQRLAGPRGREHRQKQRQIFQPRQTFSMPSNETIVLGSAAVRRALPSFSVMEIMPVSAMAKFAPVKPMSAVRYFLRSARRDHRQFRRII